MSLIGAETAVVSLGASCQTARQIRLHQALLSERLGDALLPQSLPFDWIFAPPAAAARLLRGPVRVPPGPAELLVTQQPFWLRHGVWLWHDPLEAEGDFAAMQDRQARRWARFLALRALRRRVFVVSVTQNNLDGVANAAPQSLDFRLTRARMRALADAVTEVFGPEGNSLVFLAYADRLAPDALAAGFPLAVLERDGTDHEGSDVQWAAALADLIPAG
jgi:hypothetical protein